MDSIQQMSGKVKSLTDKLMAKVKYAHVVDTQNIHICALCVVTY